MRTRQTALRMIVLSFLLVGCMCIFAACAKSEKKASAAGVYHLYSMESDGDSYSHDDIVSYGLDSMTLTLYADGTASLGFGEETEQFQWKEGMLYSDEEEIAFTVENGMLTVSMDTESMVFERVKDAPEKMEVKNPEETTGTPTDDTEVSGTDSYSDVFGKELVHLAQQDVRICAITAAMEHGTGLHHFARKYPNRYYDVGIAEQHAVTYSAALAAAGQLPVFAVYSSFLQRGYDQLMHDVALSGQHVVLGIDRAGVVGEDGETHHGLYDVSYLSTVPGAVIYAPACYDELRLCLRRALYRDHGLACVRYPRGADHSVFDKTALNTEYTHVSGAKTDVLYVSYGRVYDALYRASSRAREQGMNCDLLKLTRIFPLSDMAVEIAMSYRQVIFLEEAYYYGGISQLMGDALLERGFTGKYRRIAPKAYLPQASMESQMEQMHLSEHAIFQDMQQVFQEKKDVRYAEA